MRLKNLRRKVPDNVSVKHLDAENSRKQVINLDLDSSFMLEYFGMEIIGSILNLIHYRSQK